MQTPEKIDIFQCQSNPMNFIVVFVPFVFPSENLKEQLGDQVLFYVNLGHCADGWVDAKPDDAEHAFARIKFHSQQRGLRQTTFWGVSQRELTSSASTLSYFFPQRI